MPYNKLTKQEVLELVAQWLDERIAGPDGVTGDLRHGGKLTIQAGHRGADFDPDTVGLGVLFEVIAEHQLAPPFRLLKPPVMRKALAEEG